MKNSRAENNVVSRRSRVVPSVAAPTGGIFRWKVTDRKTGATFFTLARTAAEAVRGKNADAVRSDR